MCVYVHSFIIFGTTVHVSSEVSEFSSYYYHLKKLGKHQRHRRGSFHQCFDTSWDPSEKTPVMTNLAVFWTKGKEKGTCIVNTFIDQMVMLEYLTRASTIIQTILVRERSYFLELSNQLSKMKRKLIIARIQQYAHYYHSNGLICLALIPIQSKLTTCTHVSIP
jgi:hypothetical protein